MTPVEITANLIDANTALRISNRHMRIERDNAVPRLQVSKLQRLVDRLQRQLSAIPKVQADGIFK